MKFSNESKNSEKQEEEGENLLSTNKKNQKNTLKSYSKQYCACFFVALILIVFITLIIIHFLFSKPFQNLIPKNLELSRFKLKNGLEGLEIIFSPFN